MNNNDSLFNTNNSGVSDDTNITDTVNMTNDNNMNNESMNADNGMNENSKNVNNSMHNSDINDSGNVNSFYSKNKNQDAFYNGGYYSSSQHAGYNSQTGYTSPYSSVNNSMDQRENNSYYNQPHNSDYANSAYVKSEREIKEEEKLIKQAKKKAEKKSRKENRHSENNGKHTGRKFVKLVAAAVIFGLVAGCVFQGVRYGSDYLIDKNGDDGTTAEVTTTENNSATVTTTSSTTSTVYDVATVAEKVMPSIVSITGTYVTTYQSLFDTYEQESPGAGSGIIVGEDEDYLYILTNYHVVEDSTELDIGFVDGASATATVKGYDSSNEVAVVIVPISDISDDTMSQISVITVGSSDDLSVGDPCVAIGNALGYGQSVTVGYVSALDRQITVDDRTITVLQTDAAINPGNSGGALVNMNGELIGVNTAKYVNSSVEGVGYAIPISNVLDVINDLISGDNTGDAYLGVSVKNITEEYSQGLNMPEGVYIYSVTEDSPAEDCGLVAGDIIVEIDGEDITDGATLQEKISECSVGDEIEITFYRNENGNYVKKTVTAVLKLNL